MSPPEKPLLTIGMACFDEYDMVWSTVQALRMYHAEWMHLCEIVVVDNNPTSKDGQATRKFVTGACKSIARYVPFGEVRGSCPPRGHLFKVANGDFVMCIDAHVFMEPGSLAKLIKWIRANPESNDIIHGPMVSGSLNGRSEAMMRPMWRSEMYGCWAPDDRTNDPWGDAPAFEIPMHGLGFWCMRREAWPGFHPDLLGFSGGEGYIHEKVRQAGGRVLCLPGVGWLHKFLRVSHAPHKPRREEKVKNILRGWHQLAMNIQEVINHFCGGVGMREGRACVKLDRMKLLAKSVGIRDADEWKITQRSDKLRQGVLVGPASFGSYQMRGRPLAEEWGWPAKNSRGKVEMARAFQVGLAIKCEVPPVMRKQCERLILDVMDSWFVDSKQMRMEPTDYFQAIHRRMKFDELIATSPAVMEAMKKALKVPVHLVPHAADPRVKPGWHDPNGPIVYAGGRVFVDKYKHVIDEAARRIDRRVIWDHTHHSWQALEGASLALCLRLPPYATKLNRIGKPQVKVANAAQARIPVLCTDDDATISLWPDLAGACAPLETFNHTGQVAKWLKKALESEPPQAQFSHADWLKQMEQVVTQ